MIQIVRLRKLGTEQPELFEFVYKDPARAKGKGYFQTTKIGTEEQIRAMMHELGMATDAINERFQGAQ